MNRDRTAPLSPPIASSAEQRNRALAHFKDWTNYLLVTTVAAMGWVVSDDAVLGWHRNAVILLLAISILFAIFTLALIPVVTQRLVDGEPNAEGISIYAISPAFVPIPWISFQMKARLSDFCFPQHVTFLAAIGFYAWGALGGAQ